MFNAVQKRVLVQPGGRVEVTAPELPVGAEADVIVLVRDDLASDTKLTPLGALDAMQRSVQLTPDAAERWITEARAEREQWGNRG